MKVKLVITDLTRMQRGMVCIAGYSEAGQCIRPILLPPGISERSLVIENKPIIYPFAQIELELLTPTPKPPHNEDVHFNPWSVRFVGEVRERESILQQSLFKSVGAVFEQPIHDDFGFYVMDCQGPRSLGTVIPTTVVRVKYEKDKSGAWDYRLWFYDRVDTFYRLKITDLTWQYYCSSLRGPEVDQAKIAANLTQIVKSRKVYLRLGLARGWKEFPNRCYLQITGIYTFPDYLEGKTFLDFKPK